MAGVNLKASGITEVVIAMVIISIITTVSLLIYMNLRFTANYFSKQKMENKAALYLDSFVFTENFDPLFYDEEGYQVSYQVLDTAWPELLEIRVQVTDSVGYRYVTDKKLLYVPSAR